MIFKVYHRIEPTFTEDPDHVRQAFSDDAIRSTLYRHVANVDADNLEDVFQLTNHIDGPWTTNEKVLPIGMHPKRSTSVGDVVVDNAGETFVCACAGWIRLRP